MQVSIETTSGLERRMTIVVPSEAFEEQVHQRLQDAARRVRLDGFRPGKVPLREVRRRFGKALRQEVAGELMQSSFLEAVREEHVMPAGTPDLEVLNMDPGVDLEFTATFEVFPSIELAKLSEIKLTRPRADIEAEDVDKLIERLRERQQSWHAVERACQVGDRVTIDFVGRLDGEEFEGGSGEGVEVELGEGRMLEDFERALVGADAGSARSFDVRFPGDYGAEALRGKTVQFEVKLKQVAESRLPELDDEFFQSFGIEGKGMDAFRAEVAESMGRELESAVRNLLKQQVMSELNRLHEIQLPESLVQREIQSLRQQMLQQMQVRGGNQLPDLPDNLFVEEGRRRVKLGLLINEIVAQQELKPEPDLVRRRIEELAQGYPQPQQVIDFYYSGPEQLQQVEMAVLEDQVVDRIIEHADVSESTSSYEDIISGRTGPEAPDTTASEDGDTAPGDEKAED
jgi:trigger factor